MTENITDIFGYSKGRTITKTILLVSAIAISTFAMQGFLKTILDFELGLQLRDYLALSFVIIILLIFDAKLSPPTFRFFRNPVLVKTIYYFGLALVAIAISSISFQLLDTVLNFEILKFPVLTIRNFVAVALLSFARIIHVQG